MTKEAVSHRCKYVRVRESRPCLLAPNEFTKLTKIHFGSWCPIPRRRRAAVVFLSVRRCPAMASGRDNCPVVTAQVSLFQCSSSYPIVTAQIRFSVDNLFQLKFQSAGDPIDASHSSSCQPRHSNTFLSK